MKGIENLARFREIVTTLLEYGFEDLIQHLDVPGAGLLKRVRPKGGDQTREGRIREAMESLGPTFVKMGQMLSVRPDLVPQALITELSKLQDSARPVPLETIRGAAEDSLGVPLEEVFESFDPTPLASASLSQVHVATLRETGRSVCVKVQRPGIRPKVERDLRILAIIARQVHDRMPDWRVYNAPGTVRTIRDVLLKELDFELEAQHIRIARSYLPDDFGALIPKPHSHLCSERLLVLDRIHGERLRDVNVGREEALQLARTGMRLTLKQTLVDGFFHADPHPGNVLVATGGQLALIDWGMVGRLTYTDRRELLMLLEAALSRESGRMLDALALISGKQEITGQRDLERDLLNLLDSHYAVPLEKLRIGRLLTEVVSLLARYQVPLPSAHVLMVKAIVTAEGTARQFYTDIDLLAETEAAIRDLGLHRRGPKEMWHDMGALVSHVMVLQRNLPAQFARIVERLEKGRFAMRFEHENLGGLQQTLENTFNRLTFGIIIGALIIGSSMIITTGVKPLLFGFPALGLVGYLISAALGLCVIVSILHTRKY